MSRAITIKFFESASERIAMEEGLNNHAVNEIKAGFYNSMRMQTDLNKMELNSFVVEEIQEDIPSFIAERERLGFIPVRDIEANSESDDFPEIRYWKEGPMTFIEIIIPNSPYYGNCDIQANSVSDAILSETTIPDFEDNEENSQIDVVDLENISITEEILEIPELDNSSAFDEDLQFQKLTEKDFSFKSIKGGIKVPKSLPLHEDMMSLNDLFNEFRKSAKAKVRRKTKSH